MARWYQPFQATLIGSADADPQDQPSAATPVATTQGSTPDYVPDYAHNAPPATPDVQRGAPSLPFMRPDLFVGQTFAPDAARKRWPAPVDPPTHASCCLPVRSCDAACGERHGDHLGRPRHHNGGNGGSVQPTLDADPSSVRVVDGGQAVVATEATPFQPATDPAADLFAPSTSIGPALVYGPDEPGAGEPAPDVAVLAGGLLDAIRPRTREDWAKLGVGFAAGWLLSSWLKERR